MKKTGVLVLLMFLASITTQAAPPTQVRPPKVQLYLPLNKQTMALQSGFKPIKFMPGLYVGSKLLTLSAALKMHVTTIPKSYEELEISTASILLKTPDNSIRPISNWWTAGYTGKKAIIGVLDSGVPDTYEDSNGNEFEKQSGLTSKTLIVNRGAESGFNHYLNGVRTAHGTGVACVYANTQIERPGIAFGAQKLLVTLAGDSSVDNTDWELTLHNLDWLLTTPDQDKPTVINYSFGNGNIYCPTVSAQCSNQSDWSPVAQVVDYIVNHYKISWVKSAGNTGWVTPSRNAPYSSTLSIPADSYNAIVVANMNNTLQKTNHSLVKTSDRRQHFIQFTSSRGPTLNGRRKPDITAPGNDTRTCAPTESVYAVKDNPTFKPYTPSMQYDETSETRLVGGTSIATPHVGAATALLYDAGIQEPMAIKALLINSSDTWTDNSQPGPADPTHPCESSLPNCGHGKKMGSEWNPTYGWGYMNMDTAFKQRAFVKLYAIKPKETLCYIGLLHSGDKVTIAWERRVGFNKDNTLWALTPLSLAMYDKNNRLLTQDKSQIDNVLQVSNYPYKKQAVTIKVSIPDNFSSIQGADKEIFAIASAAQLNQVHCTP